MRELALFAGAGGEETKMKITKKQTKQIWKKTLKKYGVKTIYLTKWYHFIKRRVVKRAFREAGLDGIADRLDGRIIYVQIGRKKYLSMPKGFWDPRKGSNPWAWAIVLLAHEMTHAVQARHFGTLKFYTRYLMDPRRRAQFEAEAVYNAYRMGHDLGIKPAGVRTFDPYWSEMYRANADDARGFYESIREPSEAYYAVSKITRNVIK